MKKFLLIIVASLGTWAASAQSWGDAINNYINQKPKTKNTNSNSQLGGNLSNLDISQGLKEALSIGTNSAAKSLSGKDGFYKNLAVKILLPKELQQVESVLRKFGMSHLADELILTMNRAAEDAAKKAAPIFLNAIKNITLNDALSILNGGNGSATNYLRQSTNAELIKAFAPIVKNSLSNVGADKAWEKVFKAYNQVGVFKKVNTDLTQYVTEKATDGMYVMIAQEENKIRTSPLDYSSKIIQKVFSK